MVFILVLKKSVGDLDIFIGTCLICCMSRALIEKKYYLDALRILPRNYLVIYS